MILSLAKNTVSCALGLLLLADVAWSQTFDNFRVVGIPGFSDSTVTSLSLGDVDGSNNGSNNSELSYFDAAGLSSVFTLTLRPSTVITAQTPVLNVTEENLQDLSDIAFFTAELSHDTTSPPPHWFRLTFYQGVWSGAFRVGDQVYSLDRNRTTEVVDVRMTVADNPLTSPNLRARISGVFDTGYFLDSATNTARSHALALESIHVLDGLLADALGLTLSLEQIVVDNVLDTNDLAASSFSEIALSAAFDWQQRNIDADTIENNLATLFFTDTVASDGSMSTGLHSDTIIVQPNSAAYQFETAHNFAKLLNLREQPDTLQDWQPTGLVSLPAVHWSQQQRDDFDANTPAAILFQVLSDDQSDVLEQELEQELPTPPELDPQLVDSDSQESTGILLSDQTTASGSSGASGGGSVMWLFLSALVFFRLLSQLFFRLLFIKQVLRREKL